MTGERPHLYVVPESEPSAEADDQALMRLVRGGERSAFETLAHRHLHRVASFCARYLSDVAAGEEVAQEVFVALWQRRARYDERQKFREYLYTLAVNGCRNRDRWWRRLTGRTARLAGLPHAEPGTALDVLMQREREQELGRAIALLPARLREAVLLRFGQELDYRAIGSAVGCTEGNARARVFRALKQLREEVQP
ncbi:MAG: RNA polymerase sigma factor [Myxococcaceae bacterium]|nr:RNA polymerase sigma factor [Myxococcaceae bacterium]